MGRFKYIKYCEANRAFMFWDNSFEMPRVIASDTVFSARKYLIEELRE